jgi:hypothetical protein
VRVSDVWLDVWLLPLSWSGRGSARRIHSGSWLACGDEAQRFVATREPIARINFGLANARAFAGATPGG